MCSSLRCSKCGSTNTQSVEAAYSSSVRIGETGYQTISKFGMAVAPPIQLSVFGGAVFTAIGIGSGVLVFGPILLTQLNMTWTYEMLDKPNIAFACCSAFIAFAFSARSRLRYNSRRWAPEYAKWRNRQICRSCLHQFTAPEST